MSHDALKRLGVFSVGDRVVYTPDDFEVNDEEYATVVVIDDARVQIRYDDMTWDSGRFVERWTTADHLRHRTDLMRDQTAYQREEALRRLQEVVHAQTFLPDEVGPIRRLCGADDGKVIRVETIEVPMGSRNLFPVGATGITCRVCRIQLGFAV